MNKWTLIGIQNVKWKGSDGQDKFGVRLHFTRVMEGEEGLGVKSWDSFMSTKNAQENKIHELLNKEVYVSTSSYNGKTSINGLFEVPKGK